MSGRAVSDSISSSSVKRTIWSFLSVQIAISSFFCPWSLFCPETVLRTIFQCGFIDRLVADRNVNFNHLFSLRGVH